MISCVSPEQENRDNIGKKAKIKAEIFFMKTIIARRLERTKFQTFKK